MTGKSEITKVHITDTAGHDITGVFKDKQIKVWIESVGLIGKEIRLKLYDKDYVTDDLLANAKITIRSNIFSASIFLDRIPLSSGGDTGEGDQQELFADIEALQSGKHSISKEVNVDSKVFKPDPVEENNTVSKIWDMIIGKLPDMSFENKNESCGEKYCIKNGDPKSELIREINIRLAGFGGNVPTDEFTDRTEKMIKQFQRDYMKVPETGKICGNVLRAIDAFQNKYVINFQEIKCKCGKCSGFGQERNIEEYQNTSILEKYRKYEYSGIHRSLVCAYRASIFYIDRDTNLNYKTKCIDSGYRCHDHPIYISTGTTNHCGKAVDIHYNSLNTGRRTREISDMEKIRKDIFNKYLGAKWDWKVGQTDIFNLESTAKGAVTWVHVDVRKFSQIYLTKEYFVKNTSELNGKNIVDLANELGFKNTCLCNAISDKSKAGATDDSSLIRVDPKTLKASDKIIEFIKDWEKLVKQPYDDSKDYCTIGYGHLIQKKKCSQITIPDEFKSGIDEATATKLFKEDIVDLKKLFKEI